MMASRVQRPGLLFSTQKCRSRVPPPADLGVQAPSPPQLPYLALLSPSCIRMSRKLLFPTSFSPSGKCFRGRG